MNIVNNGIENLGVKYLAENLHFIPKLSFLDLGLIYYSSIL